MSERSTDSRDDDPPATSMDTLVFDGACGFCTAVVGWIEPRLTRPARIIPWQRADLDRLGIDADEARQFVWWVDADGRRHRGHEAIARALRACHPPWRSVGRVLGFRALAPLAAAGYGLVSRSRRHLPGTTPAIRSHR